MKKSLYILVMLMSIILFCFTNYAFVSADQDFSNTLVIAENEYPNSFDPIFGDNTTVERTMVLSYEALLRVNPSTNKLEPWVASKWSVSGDAKIYTFILNRNITFHDGTDLTASDVKFTFDRMKEIDQGIAYEFGSLDRVEVVDDYTVKFFLSEASIPFIKIIPKMYIISEEGVKANISDNDFAQTYLADHELGSGPYVLTSFAPEQQAIFSKYDDYWKGWEGNHVEKVIWQYIKESSTQRLLLEKGDVDIIMDPSPDDLNVFRENPDVKLAEGTTFIEDYFHLRTTHKPLDDIRVRKALALAYDYEAHIAIVLGGSGSQAQGPISSSMIFHNTTLPIIHQDMEKAKALLTEAGYPNGGFTFKLAYTGIGEQDQRTAVLFQSNLAELGIKVDLMAMTWDFMFDMEQDVDSEPDIYIEHFYSNSADPDSGLRDIFHSKSRGTGSNASWYQNLKVDELLDLGIVESDEVKREMYYKEIQKIIAEDLPSIFISNPKYIIAMRNYVKGYIYNPVNHETIFAYDIYLDGKP